jgi:hypothetical protein
MVALFYVLLAIPALYFLWMLIAEGIETLREIKKYQGETKRLIYVIAIGLFVPGIILLLQILIQVLATIIPAQAFQLRRLMPFSYILLLLPLAFWKWSLVDLRRIWFRVAAWTFGLFCTHMIASFLQSSSYVYRLPWTLIPWALFATSVFVVVMLGVTAYQLFGARDALNYYYANAKVVK